MKTSIKIAIKAGIIGCIAILVCIVLIFFGLIIAGNAGIESMNILLILYCFLSCLPYR